MKRLSKTLADLLAVQLYAENENREVTVIESSDSPVVAIRVEEPGKKTEVISIESSQSNPNDIKTLVVEVDYNAKAKRSYPLPIYALKNIHGYFSGDVAF